jgi:hypothetical protein
MSFTVDSNKNCFIILILSIEPTVLILSIANVKQYGI